MHCIMNGIGRFNLFGRNLRGYDGMKRWFPIVRTYSTIENMQETQKIETRISVNLRKLLAPFFIQVHPDLLQSQNEDILETNQKSMQEINALIDMSEPFCNQNLEESFHDGPVRFDKDNFILDFFAPKQDSNAKNHQSNETTNLIHIQQTIQIPKELMQIAERALYSTTYKYHISDTEVGMWRKFTNSWLVPLFQSSNLPLPSECDHLIKWNQRLVNAAEYNRSNYDDLSSLGEHFNKLLEQEKSFLIPPKNPTSSKISGVFKKLLESRLVVQDLEDKEEFQEAFKKISRLLLKNYNALELYHLIWNRCTVLISPRFKECSIVTIEKKNIFIFFIPLNYPEEEIISFLNHEIHQCQKCL